ncbi:hypothetical protein VNI00_003729 [Paramarasmius palmivorus]|uniref:Alpha/beta-hydrolase n=1 Tax=Paramarasmius palmivorus TaxID=297713 RepID=A0AAW0DU79_9AGAR
MSNYTTLTYKNVKNVPIQLDVYVPEGTHSRPLPALVWFHGGGFVVGSRRDIMFPTWLQTRTNKAGYVFISADFRLIPTGPTTGHDVLEDIKDVFAFIREPGFGESAGLGVQLDPSKVAVSGSSAGGMGAYLAAIHVEPKPAAVLAIFASGGDVLNPLYFEPKEGGLMGRPPIDITKFQDYIYPFSPNVASEVLSSAPISLTPEGLPANPRTPLVFCYYQLGKYLDYYTGQHEPSLSEALRKDPSLEAIHEQHRLLFPQFNITSSWPPTFLLHGGADVSVPAEESQHMHGLLKDAGVEAALKVVPGKDHFFDIAKSAEEECSEVFEEVIGWLKGQLN